ncbi:MAG: sugar transferase [Chloroflexi bacterium]|nr:MAG: sugar transferase [Chloroflexota bacterium]
MSKNKVYYFTITADIGLINLAFALSYLARYDWQWLREVISPATYTEYLPQQLLLNILLFLTFTQARVWRRRRGEFWVDEVSRIIYATSSGIFLMGVVTFFVEPFFTQPIPFSRLMLIWALAFIVFLISLARLVRRFIFSALYQRGIAVDRVLVISSGEVGRSVIRTLLARPDLGYKAIGYLHDGHRENNIGLGRIPHLGQYTDLEKVLTQNPGLHTVFIALPGEMNFAITRLLRVCHRHDVRPQVVPDLLQLSLNRVEFNNMAGIPTLGVRDVGISIWQRALKRGMDLIVIAVLGLPILVVTAVIAIAIKLDSPGPIIYAGERIGRNGKSFKMYKFRSMVVDADQQKAALKALNEADGPIFKIRNDPRLTRVGKWLRKTSLDELPQFYNMLIGNMSLVGPRPPLPEEVAEYKPWQRQRLSVIGGITGLWQVSGRSDLTFDELCLLDIYYIENWTLSLDIRIMLQTIPYTLFGKGAY